MSNQTKRYDDGDVIYINLTIPPNVEPGVDSLTFEYNGNEMEILVPVDSVAGDVLRVQVGCASSSRASSSSSAAANSSSQDGRGSGGGETTTKYFVLDNNDNREAANIATVTLGDGLKSSTTLRLLEKLPSSASKQQSNTNYREEGDGTQSCLWPSGIVLAQALTSKVGIEYLTSKITNVDKLERKSIECMELGSGLGTCGIALSHAFASVDSYLMHKCHIVLTDRGDETIALLRENIDKNYPFENASEKISVISQPLIWGDSLSTLTNNEAADCSIPKKYDIIIGSDILYNTRESYDPLLNTIQQHLHPENGNMILSVRWRKPDLEREFFNKAEQLGIIFENFKEFEESETFRGRCPARMSWRDYGNPSNESSNEYFHITNVSITSLNHTITKSLAEITEEDIESMSDHEYAVFEELQMQIYIGSWAEKKRKRHFDGIS